MRLSRERIVGLVNDAYGWTDLQPDALERMEAYDAAEQAIKDYEEAVAEERDAASRASSLADDLEAMGIPVDDLG